MVNPDMSETPDLHGAGVCPVVPKLTPSARLHELS